MRRLRFPAIAVGIALVIPSAALAQSAGDNQYDDPFMPSEEPATPAPEPEPQAPRAKPSASSGSSPAVDAVAGSPSSLQTPTSATATELASASASDSASGARKTLARTGAPLALPAALGVLLLASGLALRLRLGEPPRRRSGTGPVRA